MIKALITIPIVPLRQSRYRFGIMVTNKKARADKLLEKVCAERQIRLLCNIKISFTSRFAKQILLLMELKPLSLFNLFACLNK